MRTKTKQTQNKITATLAAISSQPIIWAISPSLYRTDPNNYRRITIVSALGKLFEILFNRRLVFLKEVLYNGGDKYNEGFKKNSCTSDNMLILLGATQRSQFLKKPLYVAFVDFRRAFNTINRSMMFYKLISVNLRHCNCTVLTFIINYALVDRVKCMK